MSTHTLAKVALGMRYLLPILVVLGLVTPVAADSGGDQAGPGLYRLAGTDPNLPFDDLEPLEKIVGNATFVGLGESDHTSGGYYQMKHRVFRFMVEEMGFRTFGFESPWRDAQRVSEFVETCQGSVDDALKGLFTVWQSVETRELVAWMCAWNQAHPRDHVHFYGFDLPARRAGQAQADGQDLIAFLTRIGFASEDAVIAGIQVCDGVVESFFPVRPFPPELYQQCQDALSTVAAYFDANERAIVQQTSDEDLAWARIYATSLRYWQESALYLFTDFARGYAARDRGMAYLVQAIHDIRFPHDRTALWAANGHIDKDGLSSFHLQSMGYFLSRDLGHSYADVALVAYDLNLDWPAIGRCGRFDYNNTPDSVEVLFHNLGEGSVLLDLDPRGSHPAYLEPGVSYFASGVSMVPADHFDGLIYLESAPKMTPLAWPSCQ